MRSFLLIYNRRSGQLVSIDEFEPGRDADALARRFELERTYQDDPDIEIVTLGAESLQSLKRTHGRYFRTVEELITG
jgi:hypothetical protein